jgi:3-deoxy-D-manno-octulosonic-acid transferase
MWLVFPLWLIYSWKRCKKQDKPNRCWQQLWTLTVPKLDAGSVWIHAVSLGETQAALILIRALRQHYPELPIFFTGGNKSAIDLATKQAVDNMVVAFLPLDYALLRRRLFKQLQPKLLVLMETEFWPNLFRTAHQLGVPVAIIQARLSRKSKETYPKYGQPLLSRLLAPVALIAAQTQADCNCLIELGAKPENCQLLGNIKYDFSLDNQLQNKAQTLKTRLGKRWIWVAGSTHPDEETLLVAAHQQLLVQYPDSLLILVPRHPSYFNTLAQKLTETGLTVVRWTAWANSNQPLDNNTQILLIDTLGELMPAYAVADACFVGGSFVPWGGHNMLEPAALAKPLLAGTHNHNFADIEQGLLDAQALIIVQDSDQLAAQLIAWREQPELAQQFGQHARTYFYSQQGATERVLDALSPFID